MADKKISALTASSTPLAGTEVLPIVQSSATVKVAVSDLTAGRAVSAASLTLTTPLAVANGGTGVTTSTGTGNTVLSAAPTLSGDVNLSTGNLIQGTASKGINFTANTPLAGMTSQLLNSYEEGTFTPTANLFTVVGAETITGNYIRVGKIVNIWIYHEAATSVAATATTSNYSNLPYTVARNSVNTVILDDQTVIGSGLVNAAQGKAYIGQTIVATNRTIIMTFSYQV